MIWEYKVIYSSHLHLEKTLNDNGQIGWELMSANHNGCDIVCVFKRPV